MAAREPAGTDWFWRIFAPCFSAFLSLATMGLVVYFSSQASAMSTLGKAVADHDTQIQLMRRETELRRGMRDAQMQALDTRVDQLERRRR